MLSQDTYVYPLDLNKNNASRCVSFTAISAIQANSSGKSSVEYETISEGQAEACIILPTPINLSDNQSHSWSQETTIGAFEKMSQGLGAAAGKIGSGFAVVGSAGAKVAAALGTLTSFTTGAFSIAANAGKSPVIGLVSMFAGRRKSLVNPGYFQNYTNSTPRTFEFNYTFHSRNKEEALTVLNIIRTFKYYSAPKSKINDAEDLHLGVKDANAIDSKPQTNNDGVTHITLAGASGSEYYKHGGQVQDTSDNSGQTNISSASNMFSDTVSDINDKLAETFGYMGQPDYWKITFGNSYLDKLIQLDYVVCTGVNVTYGNGSKLEMYKDGIPKIISITLSFAEVKLKMRENFEGRFTGNESANENYAKGTSKTQQTTKADDGKNPTKVSDQVKQTRKTVSEIVGAINELAYKM